jgi:hypothetical protein
MEQKWKKIRKRGGERTAIIKRKIRLLPDALDLKALILFSDLSLDLPSLQRTILNALPSPYVLRMHPSHFH